ncbi:hypothetical protein AYI68_g1629 [Smittium mucronatum]|uniref:Uncharacterized protein n=1 Tax=Smittium mucronatum TaxID=133383 RepID=A0A1R0H4U7_9FUNG|nr:hypothetical protein AYI68_g1629 [Smittium mucronatum]
MSNLGSGISLLIHPYALFPLLHVLPTLIVCAAHKVRLTGEKITGGLGLELRESPSKKDIRSFINGSPAKLTDGPKSPNSAGDSIEMSS